MLVECPKCYLSSDIDADKIPKGTTHVICPECHWKFALPQPEQFNYAPEETPIEYKFIKTDTDALSESARNNYHKVIAREALNGWELVQIFTPNLGQYGASWCEIIFKRRRENRPAA